jgi:hypothetical protein
MPRGKPRAGLKLKRSPAISKRILCSRLLRAPGGTDRWREALSGRRAAFGKRPELVRPPSAQLKRRPMPSLARRMRRVAVDHLQRTSSALERRRRELGEPLISTALVVAAVASAGFFTWLLPAIAAGQAYRVAWPWVPSLGVSLSFYLDGLSLLFALLISAIGARPVLRWRSGRAAVLDAGRSRPARPIPG